MNWVDYLLVAVVALGAWKGLTRGLIRSVVGLVSLGVGCMAALRYYAPAARFLDERFGLVPVFTDFYAARLSIPTDGPVSAPAGGGEGWALADGVGGLVSGIDVFLAGQTPVLGAWSADILAAASVKAVAFAVILGATAPAVGGLLAAVPRIPLLMPLDRAGGFCFGLCKGFIFGALVVGGLKLLSLSSLFMGPGAISVGLEESRVAPAYLGFLDYIWRLVMPLNT